LLVFAAASLTDALTEIGETFRQESEVEVVYNFAGSNLLAQQILATPRADLFLSADDTWMQTIEDAGRIAPGTRRQVLSNSLSIIAHANSLWQVDVAADLCQLDFQFLALGDPGAVPAGRYAKQWLESLTCKENTLWEIVADRVSPTPDVRAALGQVEAGRRLIGIVYQTDYRSARDRVRLLHQISPSEGPSIRYEIAALKETRNPGAVNSFLQFLYSDKAGSLFQDHGFIVIGQPGPKGN